MEWDKVEATFVSMTEIEKLVKVRIESEILKSKVKNFTCTMSKERFTTID